MTSRYNTLSIGVNNSSKYDDFFEERGVKRIEQYFTPKMRHLTADEIGTLTVISHLWTQGDRYYRLAHDYYGDPRVWWVIAWFNRLPTEADVKLGYIINIPTPVEKVIEMLGL